MGQSVYVPPTTSRTAVTPFVVLIVLLLALATLTLLYVLWPLGTRESPTDPAADRAHQDTLAIFRERQLDLTHSLPEATAARQNAIAELAEQARLELGSAPDSNGPQGHGAPRRRALALVVAVALLGASLPLYLMTGSPDAVGDGTDPTPTPHSLEELATTLQQRLQHDPKNVGAWQLLGQAELARGAPQAALAALERALALAPQDPQIKVDLADALGQTQGTRLDGRPIALIREALALAPQHPKALALAGAYAVGQNDLAGALTHWRALLDVLPTDSPQAAQIRGFIADLEAGHLPRLADATASNAPAADAAPPAIDPDKALRGTVDLAPALRPRVKPEDTVLVFARTLDTSGQPQGPPVAVLRARAADLPLSFTLDDRHAMSPQARLSSLPADRPVQVMARITRSGQAQAQTGDLQGQAPPVVRGAQGIALHIDTVVGE